VEIACLEFWQKKFDMKLLGVAIILFGIYFIVYDVVSVWNPIYRAFLPLTDFWMVILPFIGVAILRNHYRWNQSLSKK